MTNLNALISQIESGVPDNLSSDISGIYFLREIVSADDNWRI